MAEKVVELDEGLRAALAACEPIEIEGTFPYTPMAYRRAYPEDKERWPVFELKYLDGLQLARSQDKLYARIAGTAELSVSRGAHVEYVCYTLGGVAGWRGYALEYKDRESVRRLPYELLGELCDAIVDRKLLTEEEKRGLK